MLLSNYFLPLIKENPIEAHTISHRLMLRAGMIRQTSSGIYSWLPLGLKVLKNIENIIRHHMDLAGLNELLMPCIQSAELWLESGRYDVYGKEMLRISDRHDNALLFGPTNEELITDIFRKNVHSYKDLPMSLYQIQWKFRDEIRPRFGTMRGREFLMKDAYSFDLDLESAKQTYDNIYKVYLKIFKDIGVQAIPVKADNGAIGGDLSHEFHIIAATGESNIYFDKKLNSLLAAENIDTAQLKTLYAVADDKHNPHDPSLDNIEIVSSKSIEVGHIFYFGQKYTGALKASLINKQGQQITVEMGSYGIGVSRLVAAVIEASHDDKGIIWPTSIAPFKVSIINIRTNDTNCNELALRLYNNLKAQDITVLYDDTNASAGSKFATHDLIGSPIQLIITPNKAAIGIVEFKIRQTGQVFDLPIDAALAKTLQTINAIHDK